MGIPDLQTCLLRNWYAGQKATVRTGHGTTDWCQIGKEYIKAVYCHPADLTYMRNTGLEEEQAGINIAGRNINNLRYVDDNQPYGRKWRTKESLDESKRGEWKSCLKLNTQKTKIMASGPITSWEIDGETMETVIDIIFGGSKITAVGDCSHEIKRRLLLRRKWPT